MARMGKNPVQRLALPKEGPKPVIAYGLSRKGSKVVEAIRSIDESLEEEWRSPRVKGG